MAQQPAQAPASPSSAPQRDKKLMLGYLAALGAALSYGSSQVLVRHVTTNYAPPLVAASYGIFFGAIYLSFIAGRDLPNALKQPRSVLLMTLLSGFAAGGGVLSIFLALSRAPVTVVSPVAAVTPLMTLVLSAIFLRGLERITRRLVTGALLVLAGVILVILG